jgi:hypothetical protein
LATEVDRAEVENILKEKRLKNIEYDFENQVVFVVNFLRYNGRGRRDLVLKSIYNDYVNIKTPLWENFKQRYPLYFKRMLSVGKDLNRDDTSAMSNPNSNPITNPSSTPTPNLNSISNRNANHTPRQVPVKEMLNIFEKHWHRWNDGSYLHDYETEEQVADILYKFCTKDRPEDPLGLFDERVENLIIDFDVKQFVALPKFWNAAAEKDWMKKTKEVKK